MFARSISMLAMVVAVASAQPPVPKQSPSPDEATKQPSTPKTGTPPERRGQRAEAANVIITLGDPLKHWDLVRGVAFSPNGQWFASASDDGSVKLRDLTTGKEARVLTGRPNRQLSVAFYAVAFSPDSSTLAAASADKTIRVWDVATGELKVVLVGHRDAVVGLAFRPDGKVLASASDDRTVRLWDLDKPIPDPVPRAGIPGVIEPPIKELLVVDRFGDFSSAVAWSPDGKWLAVGLWDQSVQLLDMASGQTKHVLKGHTARISSIGFTPDSRSLVTAALESTVRTWSVETGKAGPILIGHSGPVFSVAVSPDGKTIASGGYDGSVRLWSIGDGKPIRTASNHNEPVLSVTFSPDGKYVASGGADAVARLTPVHQSQNSESPNGNLITVTYSRDGKRLITGDDIGTVRVWDSETGKPIRELSVGTQPVSAVAAESIIVVGGVDGKVSLVDHQNHTSLDGHKDAVRAVAVSPDGKFAASGGADQSIILWDINSKRALRTLSGHEGVITSVLFTPDGKQLISAADDRSIKIWDVTDGNLVRTLDPDEDDDTLGVAVRPDGKQIASVGNRDVPPTVKLWDPLNGATQRILPGHLDRSLAAAYRPDGKVLATVAGDGSIRLWDPATGKSLSTIALRTPRGTISQVVFHPLGDRIATVNGNGTVTVVKLPHLPDAPAE